MDTRSITCPTCAHPFAVPVDARTAICPKCGRALPILATQLSFNGDEPTPRALGRIALRRRVTRPDGAAPAAAPDEALEALEAVPTSPTGERIAPPLQLPALELAGALPIDIETTDAPEDPTIPRLPRPREPGPAARQVFHRDLSPSARVRVLSSAIEDEVGSPPTASASLVASSPSTAPPLIVPPASAAAPAAASHAPAEKRSGGAPYRLSDTGIQVVLPRSPVEEVSYSSAPAAAAEPDELAAELAPVSKRQRGRRPGSAPQEPDERAGARRRVLLFAGIGAALLVIGLTTWLLLRR